MYTAICNILTILIFSSKKVFKRFKLVAIYFISHFYLANKIHETSLETSIVFIIVKIKDLSNYLKNINLNGFLVSNMLI